MIGALSPTQLNVVLRSLRGSGIYLAIGNIFLNGIRVLVDGAVHCLLHFRLASTLTSSGVQPINQVILALDPFLKVLLVLDGRWNLPFSR
jgi:hypothetical protein